MDKRVFPAIDITNARAPAKRSSCWTRGAEPRVGAPQGAEPLSTVEAMELLTEKLDKTKTNAEFLSLMQQG